MANQATTNQAMNGAMKLTGAALTEAREALGMSQAVAARVMGVSGQSMSSWECERVKPWGKNAEKLANFIMAGKKAMARKSKEKAAPAHVLGVYKLEASPALEEGQLALGMADEPRPVGGGTEFIAKRDGKPPLRFIGWMLAKATGQSAKGAECEARFYETEGGTFVLEVKYVESQRCFSTYGTREYILSKLTLPWVVDMIEAHTEEVFHDLV